jgi:hypothetical protein
MKLEKYLQPKDSNGFIISGSFFILLLILMLYLTRIVTLTVLICLILSGFFLFSWRVIKTIEKRFSGNADLVWFPVSLREISDDHESTETETQNI